MRRLRHCIGGSGRACTDGYDPRADRPPVPRRPPRRACGAGRDAVRERDERTSRGSSTGGSFDLGAPSASGSRTTATCRCISRRPRRRIPWQSPSMWTATRFPHVLRAQRVLRGAAWRYRAENRPASRRWRVLGFVQRDLDRSHHARRHDRRRRRSRVRPARRNVRGNDACRSDLPQHHDRRDAQAG